MDFATAEGIPEEFLLGRFLVKTGALDSDTLVAALEARQSLPPAEGETSLFGAFLVQRGLVTGRRSAPGPSPCRPRPWCSRGCAGARGGSRFEPRTELPGAADQAALALQIPSLLLEGFRRVDEWRLIEREMGDFDQVFVREEERLARLGRGRLAREEQVVLELVDGRRSVRDLLDRSTLGAFDTTKMLYRLAEAEADPPAAGAHRGVNVAPKETTMSFDVLYFEVRGRRCALPMSEVREVLATPPITPVPSAPAALRGLVPVHGQVLPLVDVGPQLGPRGSRSAGRLPARWDGDRIIVVETSVANVVPGTGGAAGGRTFQRGRRCGRRWWPTG